MEEARQAALHKPSGGTGSKKDAGKDQQKKKLESSNIITLDEYNFPHAIYIYDSHHLKDDNLINGYNKLH